MGSLSALICEICGKTDGKIYGKRNMFNKALCERHYAQLRRLGRIIDTSSRSTKDRNEIRIHEEYAEIVLYEGNVESSFTIVDSEDVSKVRTHKWSVMDNGYVVTKVNGKSLLLHRLIKDCPPDMTVDHINHNKLDNRRSNLRICTQQENSFNKGMYSHNTSGIKGVGYDVDRRKWIARLMVDGKNLFLGRYESKYEASKAREKAEVKYFGEFRFKG